VCGRANGRQHMHDVHTVGARGLDAKSASKGLAREGVVTLDAKKRQRGAKALP
jgi:hypothetical protein